ncbi:MAG TPA: PPK2 family polyphosphate kinase [Actinomycetes bacterium]|nr:PPK2 family polyphosphate kinase [Actinomycetes bacterium]
MAQRKAASVSDLLRYRPGSSDPAVANARATPGAPGKRRETEAATALLEARLSTLQEQLYAEGVTGGHRRLLLVLQGMDTAGKDGTVRRVMGQVDPAGVRVTSFKAPTRTELRHDFLWRVERAVPPPGFVGIFNRSHYEDVLVARVHSLVPEAEWSTRYDRINAFERRLVDEGTHLVKVFLHISSAEQKARLLARLDDPTKHWKFNPGDVDERYRWADYTRAYADALVRCSTEYAPWYVVPADRKWYRDFAIASLLVEALSHMAPQYPPAAFDVDEQRARVLAT